MHRQATGADLELREVSEEALAYISGGKGGVYDPNGGTDEGSSMDPNG